jgi:hypothetical protein
LVEVLLLENKREEGDNESEQRRVWSGDGKD